MASAMTNREEHHGVASARPRLRVSVVIPTKNRSRLLAEAIQSVRAIEGPDLDLEILVIDNGSTDDTEDVASALGVQLLRAATPGPAAARNAGIRAATGDYIAFLDDDDVWLPEQLRPQLAVLDGRPELMACIGQVIPTTQSGVPLADPYPADLPLTDDLFPEFLCRWPQIGALVVRAAVRDTVGYLDESLQAGEEWDWHLRIALRHPVGHVAVPVLQFRSRPIASPHEDALTLRRVPHARRVFWRNAWRGRHRGLPPARVVRAALRFDGVFAGYFLQSGAVYAEMGDRAAAARSLMRAASISPLHVAWAAARRPGSLRWAASALWPLAMW